MSEGLSTGDSPRGQAAGATIAADLASIKTDTGTTIQADLDDITLDQEGCLYYVETNVTAAANAGVTVVGTAAGQRVMVEQVVIESNGATTADLTSAAAKCGAAQVNTIITAAVATQANLDAADKSVAGKGLWTLDVADTVIVDLQGGGATAVDLAITIGYRPIVTGGSMT